MFSPMSIIPPSPAVTAILPDRRASARGEMPSECATLPDVCIESSLPLSTPPLLPPPCSPSPPSSIFTIMPCPSLPSSAPSSFFPPKARAIDALTTGRDSDKASAAEGWLDAFFLNESNRGDCTTTFTCAPDVQSIPVPGVTLTTSPTSPKHDAAKQITFLPFLSCVKMDERWISSTSACPSSSSSSSIPSSSLPVKYNGVCSSRYACSTSAYVSSSFNAARLLPM
mmetsp:Transcript_984/g.2012  ORF Transcript_984/g.2012 Transcript_984/m.2012 type:complete len:226 (-) Transcript_984:805-1482(-)